MVNTSIQDEYERILYRSQNIHKEMLRTITQRFYDLEEPVIDLRALAADFDSYFGVEYDRDDYGREGLAKEVYNNLKSSFSRDAEEHRYLKELDNLLRKVFTTLSSVGDSAWSSKIKAIVFRAFNPKICEFQSDEDLIRSDKISLDNPLVDDLISAIHMCCVMVHNECVEATRVAMTSLMVVQRPDQFPKIISFNREQKPMPVVRPVSSQSEPTGLTEPKQKSLDMKVKVLLAHQTGVLNGTFHTLPIEKQYDILALLFDKSRANVKNSVTALHGNANSENNPKSSHSVVEKTNDLLRDLGIAPVVERQKR